MTIPEYRADGASRIYPMPEPHKAGKDTSEYKDKLLKAAMEMCAEEREKAEVYSEALNEAWTLVRELRATIAAKDECIATLEEYAGDLTRAARQSDSYRGERV